MASAGQVVLPAAFEDAPIDTLAILIADMLERLMALNDQIPIRPESITRFHSRSSPSISVLDYLRRIVKYSSVEKVCLMITPHYIDQICARMPLFMLSSYTCHRFIIASITVSSKGLCDVFSPNHLYAKVGGISITELNMLEREFLHLIDWNIMCTREILQEYYVNLVRTHSVGRFVISGTSHDDSSRSSASSDSDIDMISTIDSETTADTRATYSRRPSTATTDPHLQRRPTIEQNMAFAALQESLRRE